MPGEWSPSPVGGSTPTAEHGRELVSMATDTGTCYAPRCRTAPTLNVDIRSWRSLTCTKHAGVLLERKAGIADDAPVIVSLITPPPAAKQESP